MLICVFACLYIILSVLNALVDSELIDRECIDVTVQLQSLVKDSKLIVPDAVSKVTLSLPLQNFCLFPCVHTCKVHLLNGSALTVCHISVEVPNCEWYLLLLMCLQLDL